MDSFPTTTTDLSLEKLKIGLGDRLSPRRLAYVKDKYDLLKYLWKECQIDDQVLEKYKLKNIDEIRRHDDAFSRYLQDDQWSTQFTGQNEYAKQRLNDVIQPVSQERTCLPEHQLRLRFEEKKFKVQQLIRDDIGNKWREFGRNLQIKEGKLDCIDYEHNKVDRKVDAIFIELEGQCLDELTYVEEICNSLVDSRRKDLAKQVFRIMEGRYCSR